MNNNKLRKVIYNQPKYSSEGFFHEWVVINNFVYGIIENIDGEIELIRHIHIKFI